MFALTRITMLDEEVFVPITGYEQYLISADGRVYSTKSNRLLTIHVNNKGYCYVTFSMGSKRSNKNLLLHRLVCFMFGDLPSLDSCLEVNHKDYNKKNNSLENLEVLTSEQHRIQTYIDKGFKYTIAG